MKNRWIALVALPLLAVACARGADEDAALTDTTNEATIFGDTATAVTSPAGTMPMDSAMDHEGHMMDSTMMMPGAPADSAAHP